MTKINRTTSVAAAILALGTLFLTIRAEASPGDFYPSYTDAKVIAHLALSGAAPRQMFLQQAGRVTMFVSPGLTVNMTGHDGGGVNRVARKEQRHG